MPTTSIHQIEQHARQIMDNIPDADLRLAHDFAHADRVRGWALHIAQQEGYAYLELVETAALLHDIGLAYVTKRSQHAAVGAEHAAQWLREQRLFDEAQITAIAGAIHAHGATSGGGVLGDILRDADILDLLGAIGIARAYTSRYDKPIYDPQHVKGATWGLSSADFTHRFEQHAGIGATRSNIADPDQNNNNRAVSTVVQPEIDLQLTLDDAAPNPPIAGAPLRYQFRVDNNGHSTATNTIVQLKLPADSIEPAFTTSANMQCARAQAGVLCNLGIVAPAGITQTAWLPSGSVITVEVQPKASLAAGTALSMNATIDGEELEAITVNNVVSRVDAVERRADLSLQSEGVDSLIMSGNEATFTFVARNNGPSNDDDVVFSGQFSASMFEVLDVTGPNCTQEPGTITCAPGTLAPGQQATIVVRGRARSATPVALEFAAELRGTAPEKEAGAATAITQTVQIQPYSVYMPIVMH